jgi:glycosyltransferase involved in cell wall biosynthesis
MKVAVVIPSYYYADTVGRAIESVGNQTVLPSEIIVVDDCSKDKSMSTYKMYADHIQVFQTKENYGPAESKNLGVLNSSKDIDIIAFLDADDAYRPTMIEECLKVFERYPNVGLVYVDTLEHDYDIQVYKMVYREAFSMERHARTDLVGGNFVVRKNKFIEMGGFDPEMRVGENYDLTRRMLTRTLAAHIPKPLINGTIGHRSMRRKISDGSWQKSLQRTNAKT